MIEMRAAFEEFVMPHLDAAYNLARWLMGNEPDAADAVQEAYLRAYRGFATFSGPDARPWILAIVRNTCRTAQSRRRPAVEFAEEQHSSVSENPEELLLRQAAADSIQACIERLPSEYREAIVLRELEELSYQQIAEIAATPIGTVMSRLARARARLRRCLAVRVKGARV